MRALRATVGLAKTINENAPAARLEGSDVEALLFSDGWQIRFIAGIVLRVVLMTLGALLIPY